MATSEADAHALSLNRGRQVRGAKARPLHILIVGGQSDSLTILRGSLIQALIARGHRVSTAAGQPEAAVTATLSSWGAAFYEIPMDRAGMNPLRDAATIARLVRTIRAIRPDVVLGYQAKPLNYAMIAAAISRTPRRVGLITGLGYAFADGSELSRALTRTISKAIYWVGLRCADSVIFQNEDDRALFRERRLTPPQLPTWRVFGSGVDLDRFSRVPEPAGFPSFVMISRLLKDKGIYDYVHAARIVRQKRPEVRFRLVGPFDPNPTGIRPEEVEAWVAEGLLTYGGAVGDVRPQIESAHVVVHPTTYREGVPRILLEAMAMGRPIIAADVPGCRDAVVDGCNGLLVPPRSPQALALAMEALIEDAQSRARMAEAARARATELFDVHAVCAEMIAVLEGA